MFRNVAVLEEDKERIKKLAHVIMPVTWWSGEKRVPEVIEVLKPDAVSKGIYKPVLYTGLKPEVYYSMVRTRKKWRKVAVLREGKKA